MSWLKLTSKSLYLVDGNEYLEKMDLELRRAAPPQYTLDVPVAWLDGSDSPGKMIVSLKSDDSLKKHPPSTTIDRRFLKIVSTGTKLSNGLFLLEVRLMDGTKVLDKVNAVSGAPGRQAFRLPAISKAGSAEPLPEGYWDLGEPAPKAGKRGKISKLVEFASGVSGDLSQDWPIQGDGLGPVWVCMYCRSWTARSAIGFHLDNNAASAPGTDGCIGIVQDKNLKSLKSFVSWFNDPKLAPHLAIVDWGLGSL